MVFLLLAKALFWEEQSETASGGELAMPDMALFPAKLTPRPPAWPQTNPEN